MGHEMSPLNITQTLGLWSIKDYNGYYKVMSNIPKMGSYQPLKYMAMGIP